MQDSEKPFEGLGLIGWIKLIFQTRARTIKQCDNVVDMLLRQSQYAQGKMGHLIVKQREALEEHHRIAQEYNGDTYDASTVKAMTEEALALGEQPL